MRLKISGYLVTSVSLQKNSVNQERLLYMGLSQKGFYSQNKNHPSNGWFLFTLRQNSAPLEPVIADRLMLGQLTWQCTPTNLFGPSPYDVAPA